jgi:glyoxylase-like metal-dependent hydrolase (beta-lactamase superfamily II)
MMPSSCDAWARWYALAELGDRTWMVAEPGHVNCFLVAGAEQAVLIDTGLGLGDQRAAVEALTPLPVLVVNTHGHDDHRGANVQFDRVAAHPLAAAALTSPVPPERLTAYLQVARAQVAAYEDFVLADQRFFHIFTDVTRIRQLPDDADAWAVPAGPEPEPLADRQRIDLGGRELTVLHTPGHSPDSLCLLDERDGVLYAGDTLITGDFWAHTPDTELEVFAATLAALSDELAGSLRVIHPAHTMRYAVEPAFLTRAAEAFASIAAGTSASRPGTDLLGRPASRHEYGEFTVLRPLLREAVDA